MTGLGVGLTVGGAGVAAGLSLQAQISLLQGQIVAINAQLARINLNFIFLETEVDGHTLSIETITNDILVAEANINTLERNTAGLTRGMICPANYPLQQISRISDTTYINGDLIVNGSIRNTMWKDNPDYQLQKFSINEWTTI